MAASNLPGRLSAFVCAGLSLVACISAASSHGSAQACQCSVRQWFSADYSQVDVRADLSTRDGCNYLAEHALLMWEAGLLPPVCRVLRRVGNVVVGEVTSGNEQVVLAGYVSGPRASMRWTSVLASVYAGTGFNHAEISLKNMHAKERDPHLVAGEEAGPGAASG